MISSSLLGASSPSPEVWTIRKGREPQDMLGAALAYAQRGWLVFPCVPGSKRPATEHGLKDATSEPGQIRRWWEQRPDLNVAIRTGAVSNIVTLDIDPQHGGDESMVRLIEHGALPRTARSRTGRGGTHLYFAHPGGLVKNRVGLWPGIDVRGDGGDVIAPPSLHEEGKRYMWIVAPGKNGLATLPEWLVERLRKASTVARTTTHRQLAELEQTGVAKPQRNAKRGMHCHLAAACRMIAGNTDSDPAVLWANNRNRLPFRSLTGRGATAGAIDIGYHLWCLASAATSLRMCFSRRMPRAFTQVAPRMPPRDEDLDSTGVGLVWKWSDHR